MYLYIYLYYTFMCIYLYIINNIILHLYIIIHLFIYNKYISIIIFWILRQFRFSAEIHSFHCNIYCIFFSQVMLLVLRLLAISNAYIRNLLTCTEFRATLRLAAAFPFVFSLPGFFIPSAYVTAARGWGPV